MYHTTKGFVVSFCACYSECKNKNKEHGHTTWILQNIENGSKGRLWYSALSKQKNGAEHSKYCINTPPSSGCIWANRNSHLKDYIPSINREN